jgi:hypothetical protein
VADHFLAFSKHLNSTPQSAGTEGSNPPSFRQRVLQIDEISEEFREIRACACLRACMWVGTNTSLTELTDNPGNGIVATNGSILLVSSVDPDPNDADIFDSSFGPTACDPASPKPAPQLLAWSTHSQTGGEITEEEFTQITLTRANLSNAASLCGFLEVNGSGPGICDCSEEG